MAEYPNGKFAALARLRVKKLKEMKTVATAPPPEPATGSAVRQPAVGTDTEAPEDQVTMGANIDGKWITENESVFVFSGTLDLSVASDGAVTGRYTAGLTAHGEIRGTLKRDLVTGIWIANGFSTSCDTAIEGNHSWGRFEWRFNKNFTGFEGNYSRCNGLFSYFWNGARSREALSPKVGERK